MFMSEFNIQIIHKPDKSHTVLNALSCLLNSNHVDSAHDELNIEVFHAYAESVIIISADFKRQLKIMYKNDAI